MNSKLDKIHQKRLLNVARALRESKDPDSFTMKAFVIEEYEIDVIGAKNPTCGSPACALGHYAFRKDLQKTFKFPKMNRYGESIWPSNQWWDSEITLNHFGVTLYEAKELFYLNGCGRAKTAKAAARYIERFVKRKYGAAP